MKKSNLIFHPVFIISLLLLLLNDFYFKQEYGNYFTGKLSDFAGLIIFPIVVSIVCPKSEKWVSLLTAITFVLWKTPLATSFIEWFNSLSFYNIQRTIDYSDYIALIVLPLVHTIINQSKSYELRCGVFIKFAKFCVLFFSFFAICATSKTYYNCNNSIPDASVYIGKSYRIKGGKQEIMDSMKSMGFKVVQKSMAGCMYDSITYYQIKNLPFFDGNHNHDTILTVNFYLDSFKNKKSKIEISNIEIKDLKVQKWQFLKYLHKKYKRVIEQKVIQQLKNN